MLWVSISAVVVLVLVNVLIWRKIVSTSTDLVNAATALANAANALGSTATAVESLVASLKGQGLIDQPTLDSVNTSLASSLSSIQSSQTALQALIPTTPAPTTGS